MKSTRLSGLSILAVFSLCCGIASGQQTINVDFNGLGGSGTFSGVGAAPDAGTIWNGISPPDIAFTSAPLVDSTGAATPVTVSLQAYLEYAANENPADFSHPLLTDFVYQTVLGPNGPPGLFSINNLTPGGAYDLYFYGQNGGYANTATSFTINGDTKIATNPNIPGSFGPDSFIQDVNYVVFTGIVADGAGVISGAFNDVAIANNAAFNGFQIRQAPIPEPASVASAIIGGGLLLVGGVYRRRRNLRRR
jgi:hypothetical protein